MLELAVAAAESLPTFAVASLQIAVVVVAAAVVAVVAVVV